MEFIIKDAGMLEKGDVIQSKQFGYIQVVIENDKENKTITAKGLQAQANTAPYSVYEGGDDIYKGNLNNVMEDLDGLL